MQQKHEQDGAALVASTNQIQWPPAVLGVAATATAVALSVLSGWQRGGSLSERAVWIAISVVLVLAAHVLPAFCKSFGRGVRAAGAVVWLSCVAATCYGHATFVMLSQRHAGDVRAAAVPRLVVTGRSVTKIAADRAKVIERLARLSARDCRERCASQRAEHTTLTARLDALTVEDGEARRLLAAVDRADTERAAAAADPVAGALGPVPAVAQLAVAVAFAAILEAVGCFCWLLAVRPVRRPLQLARVVPIPEDARPATLTIPAANESPITVTGHADEPGHALEIEITSRMPDEPAGMDGKAEPNRARETAFDHAAAAAMVAAEIAAGRLRSTVSEIRAFLACGQVRAREVRHLALSLASSN